MIGLHQLSIRFTKAKEEGLMARAFIYPKRNSRKNSTERDNGNNNRTPRMTRNATMDRRKYKSTTKDMNTNRTQSLPTWYANHKQTPLPYQRGEKYADLYVERSVTSTARHDTIIKSYYTS